MFKLNAVFPMLMALAPSVLASSQGDDVFERDLPAWVDGVQTYAMVPVLPGTAKEMNATVNGIWAGIGGKNPIITNPEIVPAVSGEFDNDEGAFVKANRDAGLISVSIVNGLEGFDSLREQIPNLEELACRNGKGQPSRNDEFLLMCTNNPAWVEWEIEHGKRGIDAGADLIMVDTPMSSSFIAGFLGGGFCEYCMRGFEKHLKDSFSKEELEDRFELAEFGQAGVSQRLNQFQFLVDPTRKPFLEETADAELFREFIAFQEQASFDTRKRLVDALRAYAESRNRKVAFYTNGADLGTGNPNGHWIRALMFADLFDAFAYEQNVLPHGQPFAGSMMKPPRGKWAAYHKLAYAIKGRRSAAVIRASDMGQILVGVMEKDNTTNAMTAVQCAEAYAANGAYVLYYIEPMANNRMFLDACWKRAAGINGFVLENAELFSGDLRSGSSAAFVFLFNERGRTIPAVFPSYLGLAQGFIETNHAFDVVFGGDGRYVKDRLSANDLAPYQSLIVPSAIAPTDNQKRLIGSFVRQGGTLVCQEPALLGLEPETEIEESDKPYLRGQFAFGEGKVLVLAGAVEKTGTNDVGSRFFTTYDRQYRDQIGDLASVLGLTRMLPPQYDGLVSAYPLLQPDSKQVVVHLVNYDGDFKEDRMRTKKNIPVRVPVPAFLSVEAAARMASQEKGDYRTLNATVHDGAVEFTVPELDIAASAVVWDNAASDSSSAQECDL